MTTSFTSGMPRRDTCTKLPALVSDPGERVVVVGRLAVAQTPMIGLPARSAAFGTRNARLWTLKPARLSVPASLRLAPYNKSKTRRSRKNGSSVGPANTAEVPPTSLNVLTPAPRPPYCGVDAGPTLSYIVVIGPATSVVRPLSIRVTV